MGSWVGLIGTVFIRAYDGHSFPTSRGPSGASYGHGPIRKAPEKSEDVDLRPKLRPSLAPELDEALELGAHFGAGDDGVDLALVEEELGPLEALGEFLLEGGGDHARAGEADQGAGFGQGDVADAGEGGRHAARGGVGHDADREAAGLVEPVQGEGGFNPAPKEFLEGLRARCDEHGILMIADEIQSGMGRTGHYFAFERAGVEPDFICVAKSIAAGLPLSALTGKADLMDKVLAGSMGSTYGGNPVACAAALAVFDIIEEEGLLMRAEEIGAQTEKRWKELQAGVGKGVIGDVRRVGGMMALEFVKDGDPKQPNGEVAGKILAEARSRGLIMTTAGAYAQCLRSLVPLVISDDLLNEGLDIFAEATEAVLKD